MPTLKTVLLPPPQDWSEFEDICCDLWRLIWSDPNAQKNGRKGQAQNGVDIFGHPQGGSSVEGIQCKATNAWLGRQLNQKDIENEIAAALTFKPRLSRLIIATTAPRDARLQEAVRLLSEQNLLEDSFPVTILFWDEIYSRLCDHEHLLCRYYPQWFLPIRSPVETSEAVANLETYRERLRLFLAEGLPPMIPTRLLHNEAIVHPVDFKTALAEFKVIHLHGPSGSGKSHFAKHLAIDLTSANCLPLLLPARYYSGDLASLLDRSVAHLIATPAESLLRKAAETNCRVLLILDGFNECPDRLRGDLAQDLVALRLRFPVAVVVTSRPEVTCAGILNGPVFRLSLLDLDERKRFLAYYGVPQEGIIDILRTPLDIQIAAESAARLSGRSYTQYELFHAYARERLAPQDSSSFTLLIQLARQMATAITNALPEAEFHRLLFSVAPTSSTEVQRIVMDSDLLSCSQGYCAFWHEKLQRFFQAEVLLLDYPGLASLADELERPINEDSVEFVLGAVKDSPDFLPCLLAVRSRDLLTSVLEASFGATYG